MHITLQPHMGFQDKKEQILFVVILELDHIATIEDINIKVNEVKNIIDDFNQVYFKNGNIPDLNNPFKINLFNLITFH